MLTSVPTASYDTRMLAMADRLFAEFDRLPAGAVFRALGAARAALRQRGQARPEPAEVDARARAYLLGADVLPDDGRLLTVA